MHFRLDQDEDGYPPVAVESVWAKKTVTPHEYVLDNVPFFARDATVGDVVIARDEDGHLWFEKIVVRSGNSLLRVVFFDRSCVDEIRKHLESLGCSTEYDKAHNLVAVSVPPSVALTAIQDYLRAESDAERIDYEEAILGQ